MRPDTIEELLRDIPVGDAAGARDRAVSAARAEIEARRTPTRTPRRPRRRAMSIAFAAALLGAGLLTAPGRAATGWVGDLVGVGDVGESPTQKHRGFEGKGAAIVVNNGFAPDGSRYEWVVYPCKVNLRDEGLPENFKGLGLSFEWPGRKQDGGAGGGSCEGRRDPGERTPVFGSFGTQIVPDQFKGVAAPDLVVSGTTGPDVYGVRVVYVDAKGGRHNLDVDFARIGPKLRGKLTPSASLGGTFVAFIPGKWAARDEIVSRLDLRALETTGKLKQGPIGRRERRRSRRAQDICAPKQPDLSKPIDPNDLKAQERAFAPYRRCLDAHGPVSPVQYIAYGKHGQRLASMPEPLMMPAPRGALPEAPPLTKRPVDPDTTGKPVVLAGGRSPDGARYEWFVSHFEDKHGKVYGNCTELWWPGQPVPSGGSCGPGLPPERAYGRRHPERVFAKPFGFLGKARPASRYLMLSGYARPNVARVRVVYAGGRDAPVDFTRVDEQLAKQMAADGPFGFFVAFVPPKAGKHPIDVIAYDGSGRRLSSFEYHDPQLP
jgi:hypothetical protein